MYSERLKALSKRVDQGTPIVSLYLNVTPPTEYRSALNSLIHTNLKRIETENNYSKNQIKKIQQLTDKIEDYIRHRFQRSEKTRMIVIYADPSGMWEEFQLPVAVPSRLLIEPHPYIKPLTLLMDKFEKYGVLLVNNRSAKFFVHSLGEFEEYSDVFIQDYVPDNVHANISVTYSKGEGVQSGLGEPRVRRHIEDHIHRHLKHVADRTFELYREKRFGHLIIGGSEDKIVPWLKNHLHSYLQNIIVGEVNVNPERNIGELKDKIIEVVQQFEWQEEKNLIEQLEEQNYEGGKAVLGLEQTINALMMGQIHTLAVRDDYRTEGYLCPDDHCISTETQQCPTCSSDMVYTDDLAEVIIEEAINQNAEIKQIAWNNQQFEKHGIGAILRFTLTEEQTNE
jgi:peptide chain release factor subunit 1